MARCPALKAVVDNLNRTLQVSRDETQVLIHTLGHLEHGPEAVNALFQRCLNADPSLFLKSRLRGNPMSCPKIRVRILKENLLWVRTFRTLEELRQALLEFKRTYNENWIIQRHGYHTPAQVRRQQLQALPLAA